MSITTKEYITWIPDKNRPVGEYFTFIDYSYNLLRLVKYYFDIDVSFLESYLGELIEEYRHYFLDCRFTSYGGYETYKEILDKLSKRCSEYLVNTDKEVLYNVSSFDRYSRAAAFILLEASSIYLIYRMFEKSEWHYDFMYEPSIFNISRLDKYLSFNLSDYLAINKNLLHHYVLSHNVKLSELQEFIVPERDTLYNLQGMELLLNTYLLREDKYIPSLGEYSVEGGISELPQYMHLAIAMQIHGNIYDKEEYLKAVKETYDVLSTLVYINPTPLNVNGRKKDGGLVSCMLIDVQDDSHSILDGVKEAGLASKQGSGLGIDISRIRSEGSSINGNTGVASGKIPFMKMFNSAAMAFDQNRKRPGAFALYVECWDLEIFDFIDTKKPSGDERRRARDIYLAVSYRDLFFKREAEDGEWTLFDPYDVPDLFNLYGEEWERRYIEYENEYKLSIRKSLPYSGYTLSKFKKFNPNTKVVKCSDILRYHLNSWAEIGQPFFFFKDTANIKNPTTDYLNISNLCTEVILPTSPKYTAVCNLGSINLARIRDEEHLREVTRIATKILDRVIDITIYPSDKSRAFQQRYRSIGLGTLGEAEAILNQGIVYGSKEHKEYIDRMWSIISEECSKTSKELAIKLGKNRYGDEYRNSYRTCIAPNSNSALLAGTSNGVEPFYDMVWTEENQRGTSIGCINNYIPENKDIYLKSLAFNIDPFKQIELAAIRQKYIDMSISLNIFIPSNDLSVKYLRDIVVKAWKSELKTLYYLRTTAPTNSERKVSCIGCVN